MKVYYDLASGVDSSDQSAFLLSHRKTLFPVWCHDKGSPRWVVFFPGATRRNVPPPVFQRSSYSNDIEANTLSLFDPSLLLHRNLTNTWFAGTPNHHHAHSLGKLLSCFFENRGIPAADVLLFGTSAAGIPGAIAARQLPGSSMCVGNIQSRARQHPAFSRMLPLLFPRIPAAEFTAKYAMRFELDAWVDGSFRLWFFQNKKDTGHFRRHFLPFRQWAAKKEFSAQLRFYVYDDASSGHGSVGREKEIRLINSILMHRKPEAPWASEDR